MTKEKQIPTTLAEISEQLEIILLNDTIDGGMSDDAKIAIDRLSEDFDEKARKVAYVIKILEKASEYLKSEGDRITNRKRANEVRVKWLRGYLAINMENLEKKQLKYPDLTINVRHTESIEVLNQEAIPKQYIKETIKYDVKKSEIMADIKAGKECPNGVSVKDTASVTIR